MSGRSGFLKVGHPPTLLASLLYFDVSFMVWVLLGPLAPFLHDDLHLTATEQGLLTGIPLLGGSLFRPVMGLLGDRIGGRRAGLLGLTLTLVPLAVAWQFAGVAWHFYALGFFLGIAGASFAVALPLASRWYPPEYQGLAMGIAGAGNSGTLLATLFAPRLAERFGWAAAMGLAMVPVGLVLVAFLLLARDSPAPRPRTTFADVGRVVLERDAVWLSFLYSLTFGGFVGFSSFLTTFFHDQYAVSRVAAGDFTTIVAISGSLLRPVGGWLSDRFGGYRMLVAMLGGMGVCLLAVSTVPPVWAAVALLFVGMGMLGMGNGAVFQLVPQRFPDRIGLVTGVVGAAGGLGGFFLPTVLGIIRDAAGSYATGLVACGIVFLTGVALLLEFGIRWAAQWPREAVMQAGVYSYRPRDAPEAREVL